VAVLIRHPEILRDVEHAFCELELPPVLGRIREALLAWAVAPTVLDSQGLMTHLTSSGLAAEAEQVLATVPVPLPEFASAEAMPGDAEAGWWYFFGLMHHARLAEEVAAARKQFELRGDQDSQRRLLALRAALIAVETGEPVGT
jgi:DNA primase